MSDMEKLRQAIITLDGISVPSALTEQVSIPIYNANNILKSIYAELMKQIEKKDEKPAAKDDDVDFEISDVQIVPDDEVEQFRKDNNIQD